MGCTTCRAQAILPGGHNISHGDWAATSAFVLSVVEMHPFEKKIALLVALLFTGKSRLRLKLPTGVIKVIWGELTKQVMTLRMEGNCEHA